MESEKGLVLIAQTDNNGHVLGKHVDDRPALSPFDPAFSQLHGKYCKLIHFHESHLDELYEAYSPDNDTLWTYLLLGPFNSKEEFDTAFSNLSPSSCMYTIISLVSGRAVGNCAYLNINTANKSIEVGSLIFSRHMKKSLISTEAMYLMMGAAFNNGYRRYEWKCNALNCPSIAAAQRYGFSFEGLFRNFVVVRGRNRDTAWFSIIEEDWPKINEAFLCWFDESNFDSDGRQVQSLSQLTGPYVLCRFPHLSVKTLQI